MITAAVLGSSGRMGKEILEVLVKDKRFSSPIGYAKSAAPKAELKVYDSLEALLVQDFSVSLDFTHSEFFDQVLSWSVKNKKALVSGTTGLSEKQIQSLTTASKEIPILWAPNMSVGVAFINHLVKQFGALEGFDFQIYETHHKHKKDAPSGTAIFLQDTLKKAVTCEVPEPLSLRMGGEYGHHVVKASSEEETICLEHRALNRSVFAKGAVRAAYWLSSQSSGLYNMSHVLGI